jgi:hypothetical protein
MDNVEKLVYDNTPFSEHAYLASVIIFNIFQNILTAASLLMLAGAVL